MLSAFPPISQGFLLPPSPFRTSNPDPPPSSHQSHQHGHPPRLNPPPQPTRSALSTLLADEASFAASKERARKFGAGWLKPPGLTKTLQGMEDDRLEREEQDAVANRELALLEEQAAAEQAQTAQGLLQGDGAVEMGQGEEITERDLDAEVPEADGDGGWETSSEAEGDEDEENMEERMDVEVEHGEGSMASGQEEGATRDLDDDVPEAGSYQHTDTDVEDESSDGSDVPAARWSGRQSAQRARNQQLNSSLLGSSPVEQRRGRGGGRRSGGRRTREN